MNAWFVPNMNHQGTWNDYRLQMRFPCRHLAQDHYFILGKHSSLTTMPMKRMKAMKAAEEAPKAMKRMKAMKAKKAKAMKK